MSIPKQFNPRMTNGVLFPVQKQTQKRLFSFKKKNVFHEHFPR